IIRKAKELGADLVGIASIEALKDSSSHHLLSAVGARIDGEYPNPGGEDFTHIEWPTGARTALVIALAHPETKPELDWWSGGDTIGNRRLILISKELSGWIEEIEGIKTYPLPYHIERGGIYLKDAAALAGLGCIGRNNLLVTTEFGPRVRLRTMLFEAELHVTGPIDYDPCKDCPEYCRKACPQSALDSMVSLPQEVAVAHPPARDGFYRRAKCVLQMNIDRRMLGNSAINATIGSMDREEVQNTEDIATKPCRQCELACPVGSVGHGD
ncbi:MAG: epoxyqueuosine reductase, partial [Candidatus Thorarchaeota archaeon]